MVGQVKWYKVGRVPSSRFRSVPTNDLTTNTSDSKSTSPSHASHCLSITATMHNPAFLSSLVLALSLTASISAQSLDHDDIAPQCASVCTNIANVSDECERQNEDVPNEDRRELDCICNAPGMDTLIPACEACQRQYYGRDDDYDEIRTLLRRCGVR